MTVPSGAFIRLRLVGEVVVVVAPPMPWPGWRYMSDKELFAIAAYLKRGVKPVSNKIPESEGPPDFRASTYTVKEIGPYPPPAFPAASERVP